VIRVLVADDSRSFRSILRAILEKVPGLEVVGEAVDGADAVAQTIRLRPDVVTMDVRMPGQDGLAAVEEIMERVPTPVVVVSAEAGPENQEVSFRALALGALEVLRKPSSREPGRFDRDADAIRAAVQAVAGTVPPRRAFGGLVPPGAGAPAAAAPPRPARVTPPRPVAVAAVRRADLPVRAVGLVASTGGPPALARLLGALRGDFPAPILVVQHIASGFEGGLVRWLDGQTPLEVKLAAHREPLRPGTVYLAPDGRHLTALAGEACLEDGPALGGFKPSGNALLASLAREYGGAAGGVILTGMGDDGVDGLEAVRRRGGATLAQGPATSVIFGMPRQAIERGVAAETLEIEEIGPALVRLVAVERGPP
jgi:two-component system chemotaxis response regulator CheB